MRCSVLVALVAAGVLVAGCGVSAQDEPEPLVTSSVVPDPIPTLNQRPDHPSSPVSSPVPTSSPSETPSPAATG
jgi:hypothetical protein